jgi:hypothetical protein
MSAPSLLRTLHAAGVGRPGRGRRARHGHAAGVQRSAREAGFRIHDDFGTSGCSIIALAPEPHPRRLAQPGAGRQCHRRRGRRRPRRSAGQHATHTLGSNAITTQRRAAAARAVACSPRARGRCSAPAAGWRARATRLSTATRSGKDALRRGVERARHRRRHVVFRLSLRLPAAAGAAPGLRVPCDRHHARLCTTRVPPAGAGRQLTRQQCASQRRRCAKRRCAVA